MPQPLAELGLTAFPFPKAPKMDAMFRWPALDELLARLAFAHANHGFALLTGDPGSGKSAALRIFLHTLDPNVHPAVYIADSGLSPRSFYRRVLEHFGVLPAFAAGRARSQFQTMLSDLCSQGQHPLILIDEGHELSPTMVAEFRYLQNTGDCDATSPFTLIVSGQSQLRAMLRFKTFEAVAQRVTVRCSLGPLTLPQATAFVTDALERAGIDRPLFTEAALQLLHTHSRGLLRPLGNLATHALLDAALAQTPLVEEYSVRRAVSELED